MKKYSFLILLLILFATFTSHAQNCNTLCTDEMPPLKRFQNLKESILAIVNSGESCECIDYDCKYNIRTGRRTKEINVTLKLTPNDYRIVTPSKRAEVIQKHLNFINSLDTLCLKTLPDTASTDEIVAAYLYTIQEGNIDTTCLNSDSIFHFMLKYHTLSNCSSGGRSGDSIDDIPDLPIVMVGDSRPDTQEDPWSIFARTTQDLLKNPRGWWIFGKNINIGPAVQDLGFSAKDLNAKLISNTGIGIDLKIKEKSNGKVKLKFGNLLKNNNWINLIPGKQSKLEALKINIANQPNFDKTELFIPFNQNIPPTVIEYK